MYIFCFDEQGQFEDSNYQGPLFVGGFLYDSPSEKDVENERERILQFFEKACNNTGTVFPTNLHPRFPKDMPCIRTKEEYIKHFAEFIINGQYNNVPLTNEERKGSYRFFIHLSSPAGKSKFSTSTNNLFAQDSRISNRYDHMTRDFICYGLFLNPDISGKSILLDFPSRLTVGNDKKGYESAGYDAQDETAGRYFGTDEKVYRTVLQAIGTDFSHKQIGEPTLTVKSITKGYFAQTEEEQKEYAFLMFADAVCSVTAKTLTSPNNGKLKNKEYEELLHSLEIALGANVIMSLYDDVDELYTDAVLSADNGDIPGFLKTADELSSLKTRESKYYSSVFVNSYVQQLNQSLSDKKKKDLLISLPTFFEKEKLTNKTLVATWAFSICESLKSPSGNLKQDIAHADLSFLAKGILVCPFSKCLSEIEDQNYYSALECLAIIDAGIGKFPDSAEEKLLSEELFRFIEEKMEPKDYKIAAGTLDDNTRENKIDETVDYILARLLLIKENRLWADKNNHTAAFSLYKAGIAIRNHEGRPDLAKIYLQQIKKLKRYLSETDYNQCMNRFIVSYIDLFDFDAAFLQSLEKVKASGNLEMEFKNELHFETIEQAKDYSQLAQICSFMNRNNTTLVEKGKLSEEKFDLYKKLTKSFFLNALKRFRKGSDDYKITLNYYLHYLISEGEERYQAVSDYENTVQAFETDGKHLTKAQERKREKILAKKDEISQKRKEYNKFKAKYLEYSAEYFGTADAGEQLAEILSLFGKKKPRINPNYALALWCKALLVFYNKKDTKKIIANLPREEVKKRIFARHPWELICFYLARIYHKIGDEKAASEVLQNVTEEMESSDLLSIIVTNARMKYYGEIGLNSAYESEKEALTKKLKKYTNRKLPKDNGVAENIVTYTYC